MALFTDGVLSTIVELTHYENGILNIASTENIDIAAKSTLAQNEIATELLLFLGRNSASDPRILFRQRLDLANVAVTEPLKRWHAYKTLALVYQDAYNNQLNDRYQGKWDQYNALSKESEQKLLALGVGIIQQPIPKGSAPVLTMVPMEVTGVSYYARLAWVSSSGQEGSVSEAVLVQSGDGSGVLLGSPNPPAGILLWNVYAGAAPDGVTLQTASPLAVTGTWTLPSTGMRMGRAPSFGQFPEWWIVERHVLPRG